MEVAITTGVISRAKLRSKCLHQQTNNQFFFTASHWINVEALRKNCFHIVYFFVFTDCKYLLIEITDSLSNKHKEALSVLTAIFQVNPG